MSNQDRPLLLEVHNLRTYFFLDEGTVRAVDGADFVVYRGQTLGVVGESGCGKSVTARSILRIVPPPGRIVEGKILYHRVSKNGGSQVAETIDLTALDPRGREIRRIRGAEISMVFQEPMTSLSPVHTIGNQIMEAIMLHQNVTKEEAREKAIEMLDRVGMPQPQRTVDRYPHQLSGGMRQRAMIAMALSCHPALLIADEPTTALDVTTEAQILKLMRELQRDLGMAIMFITHNLGVIAQMTEDVIVMYLGKVVEATDVDTLFYNPKHPYTQALLRSIPRVGRKSRERLHVIPGWVPDPYSVPEGCPFHPRCDQVIRGVCEEVEPPYVEVEPGHQVRCHLYAR
ncbi:MAG TPA: ABC transporter ATP-binding protein [Caldilineae bacterium]|nr:ABC transporter ATP-binding protein [Caldilineae bacterium]